MKYRLEFDLIGVDEGGSGEEEFEAENDKEAISRVKGILHSVEARLNNGVNNQYYHINARDPRLVRIIQSEISEKVELPSLTSVK